MNLSDARQEIGRRVAFRMVVALTAIVIAVPVASCSNGPVDLPPLEIEIEIDPPSATLVLGNTVQLTAVVKDAQGHVVVSPAVSWSSSDTLVVAVGSSGLLSGKSAGTAVITASIGEVSAEAAVQVHAPPPSSSADPAPPPPGSSLITRDWRTGGVHDIQEASTYADARSKALFAEYQNNPMGFTTNLDGKGTRAFTFPVKGGLEQLNQAMVFGPSLDPLDRSGSIYVQWKVWMGRTATGNGVSDGAPVLGDVGSFSLGYGKKWFVWFFEGGAPMDYRLTMLENSEQGRIWNEAGASGQNGGIDLMYGNSMGEGWWPRLHSNRVNTITVRIKKESAAARGDGEMQMWVNGEQIFDRMGLKIGHWQLVELQLGGPTWRYTPQDQTMYFWDFVAWKTEG